MAGLRELNVRKGLAEVVKPMAEDWRRVGRAVDYAVDSTPYKAAQAVPGLNVPLSVVAYGSHMDRGNYADAGMDAASIIPGVKLVGYGTQGLGGLRAAYNVLRSDPMRLGDPRIAARMLGRKVGVGMQGEQAYEIGSGTVKDANAISDQLRR